MHGADICMMVKYNIEVPNKCSAEFWKDLTEKFNISLIKRQHTLNGENLYIELKIIDLKEKI